MIKLLLLDVLGVLVDSDSLLNEEDFLDFCSHWKNEGNKIVLFSNSHSKILRDEKVSDFFYKYVDDAYFADFGPLKPSKESFDQVFIEHDIKPEEVIFVDDGLSNIEVANQIGLKTILHIGPVSTIKKLKEISKSN